MHELLTSLLEVVVVVVVTNYEINYVTLSFMNVNSDEVCKSIIHWDHSNKLVILVVKGLEILSQLLL